MNTYTQVPQRVFADLLEDVGADSVTAASSDGVNDADVARSEDNILRWMEYLPEDCIRTMILMGWDVST